MNKTSYRIPFNRPPVVGGELEAMAASVASGHLSGDGSYTRRCHALLEQETGCAKALLTTSCTHALEMAALLLDIKPGDEVIVPSYTFVSTVNAFVLRGATPVFADVRPDTLNLDERALPGLITGRTRCIVPVHYAGVACAMEDILAAAAIRDIPVVEDNAHGLYGRYQGRPLGSWGCLATQSFHETKNFTCGEGGALLINDPSLTQRAEIIREKGTNRSRFFRGEVDKYSWVDVGSSYLPSEILAAYLAVQLEHHDRIQARRKAIWNRYRTGLDRWAGSHGVRLPVIPAGVDQAYHMFYLLLPDEPTRARVIAYLKSRGILAVFHYLPLHLSDMGRQYGGKEGDCPVTESISEQLLRLPMFYALTDAEQDEVIAALLDAPL
jgi:dTDP-4-amino-4,6-dideoxygalactose transaminase